MFNTVQDAWANLLAGKSGIATVTKFDHSNLSVHFAGEVKDFHAQDFVDSKFMRRFDRFIQYGMAAAIMAMEDSGLKINIDTQDRVGVITHVIQVRILPRVERVFYPAAAMQP